MQHGWSKIEFADRELSPLLATNRGAIGKERSAERGSKVRRNMAGRGSSAASDNITRPQLRDGGTKAILGAKVLEKTADILRAKCGEHVTADHGSERAQEGR